MKGTSKNSNFFVRARKHRPESRSLRGVNEDSRTELTPLSRKKCIFRDALKLITIFGGVLLLSACMGPQPCQEGVSYCHSVQHHECSLFGDDCDAVSYIAGDNCEIMATYPWVENQTEKVVAGTSCDVPEAYSQQTCDFIQNQTYAENADGTGVKLVFEKQTETSGFLFLGEAFTGVYGDYSCQSNQIEIVLGGVNASADLGNTKGELTFNYDGESYLLLRQPQHWNAQNM